MTKDYRMFMDSKGVRHKYKKKSWHHTEKEAEKQKTYWKGKFYSVRIIKGKKAGKRIYKVYAFALWD